MSLRRRAVALAVLCSLATAACASGDDDPLAIGMRRVALDLIFAKEELAKPIKPEVIIQILPPIEGLDTPADLDKFRAPRPRQSLFPPCPTAPPGRGPAKPVLFSALRPPDEGMYTRHNTGELRVLGAIPLTLPFPPVSAWHFGKSTKTQVPPAVPNGDPTYTYDYELKKVVAPGFEVVDTLRLLSDRIELVRRTTTNQGVTTTFTPSPPVRFYTFGDEGSVIAGGGVDRETNQSMVIQGTIERRENVDVCGEVIDTWRVAVNELMVDLDTGETSGTPQGDPNVYNYATQYGGLVVREDIHMTQTVRAQDGSLVPIELEYVSTLDSVEPKQE